MSKFDKLIFKLLSGNSDKNFELNDLILILERIEFKKRIEGSHHIFYKEDIDEIINLQPDGKKAKAYQVKQVRDILIKYKLVEINGA